MKIYNSHKFFAKSVVLLLSICFYCCQSTNFDGLYQYSSFSDCKIKLTSDSFFWTSDILHVGPFSGVVRRDSIDTKKIWFVADSTIKLAKLTYDISYTEADSTIVLVGYKCDSDSDQDITYSETPIVINKQVKDFYNYHKVNQTLLSNKQVIDGVNREYVLDGQFNVHYEPIRKPIHQISLMVYKDWWPPILSPIMYSTAKTETINEYIPIGSIVKITVHIDNNYFTKFPLEGCSTILKGNKLIVMEGMFWFKRVSKCR